MATIKLQPSGKVVIKDGKVACACCNPCGCSALSVVPESLREILENATSAFIWGYNTNEFFPGMPEDDFFWVMNAFFPGGFPIVSYDIFVEMTYFKNGCLYFRGEYYTLLVTDPDSLALYGDPVTCDHNDEAYVTGTASINGEGGFAYWYATSNGLVAPPVPNIVFS